MSQVQLQSLQSQTLSATVGFPGVMEDTSRFIDIVSAREEANVVWMNYGWTTAAPPRDNSSQPFKYPGFAPWRDSEAESWVSLSNKYARDHILIKSCEVTHSFGSHSFHRLHFKDVYEFVKSMMNMFRFAVPGSEGSFTTFKEKQNSFSGDR